MIYKIKLWLWVNLYCLCTLVFFFSFPEDKLEQQHALFTQYKDPCRLGPGEDKPWALGNNTHTHTHTHTQIYTSRVRRSSRDTVIYTVVLLAQKQHQQQKLILKKWHTPLWNAGVVIHSCRQWLRKCADPYSAWGAELPIIWLCLAKSGCTLCVN